MTFFESLLVLLLVAVVLLQLSRRVALPYPALLAVAGVAVAFIPGAPAIRMDPDTALALFIAPVLLDAAYDFPVSVAGALWRPMLVLAAGVTLATAAAVGFIGWWAADMPIAAALVLGAIVAPPDAAAAVAVLGSVSLPRRTIAVLKGESLFNDAVALLLFTGALTTQARGGLDGWTELQMVVAVPGGIMLGVTLAAVMRHVSRFVANTLGGNMLQFLSTYLVWIVAEHLGLSAVLAVVGYAMTLARWADVVGSPRMRVHSMAVWASVVFLLNVLAFLLMGMQARLILARIPQDDLWHTARIVGLVLLAITVTRFVLVMAWNQVAARFPRLRGPLPAPTVGQGVVVAWSGMRGLVTLATSFALPSGFPQRDLVVLIAFAVVLVTLVVQGLTLAPLIRLLRLDRMESSADDLRQARRRLAQIGLKQLDAADAAHDLSLGALYRLKCNDEPDAGFVERLQDHRRLGLAVAAAQRQVLRQMRDRQEIDIDVYYKLQEEIDWRELTLLPDEERQILEA